MAEIGDYFGALEPDRMTDAGMWIWATIIALVSLGASYAIAVVWQKWKERVRT